MLRTAIIGCFFSFGIGWVLHSSGLFHACSFGALSLHSLAIVLFRKAESSTAIHDVTISSVWPVDKDRIAQWRESVRGIEARIPGPKVASVEEVKVPSVTEGPRIPVYVYTPFATKEGTENSLLPVLIWVHGGNWVVGSRNGSDALARRFAVQAEVVVVNVGYRLSPKSKFPAAQDDVSSVIRYFGVHAERFGGNPASIAVGGEGAGGNLAASAAISMLGTQKKTAGPQLCLQLLVSPFLQWGNLTASMIENRFSPALSLIQLLHGWQMYLENPATDGQLTRVSPLWATDKILKQLGRVHLIGAGADVVRDEGDMYVGRIQDLGGLATSSIFPGVPHGFFADESFEGGIESFRDACVMLRTHCRSATRNSDEVRKAKMHAASTSEQLELESGRKAEWKSKVRDVYRAGGATMP